MSSRDQARVCLRAVAMTRRGFGSRPLGPEPGIAADRRTSRISRFRYKPQPPRAMLGGH